MLLVTFHIQAYSLDPFFKSSLSGIFSTERLENVYASTNFIQFPVLETSF